MKLAVHCRDHGIEAGKQGAGGQQIGQQKYALTPDALAIFRDFFLVIVNQGKGFVFRFFCFGHIILLIHGAYSMLLPRV